MGLSGRVSGLRRGRLGNAAPLGLVRRSDAGAGRKNNISRKNKAAAASSRGHGHGGQQQQQQKQQQQQQQVFGLGSQWLRRQPVALGTGTLPPYDPAMYERAFFEIDGMRSGVPLTQASSLAPGGGGGQQQQQRQQQQQQQQQDPLQALEEQHREALAAGCRQASCSSLEAYYASINSNGSNGSNTTTPFAGVASPQQQQQQEQERRRRAVAARVREDHGGCCGSVNGSRRSSSGEATLAHRNHARAEAGTPVIDHPALTSLDVDYDNVRENARELLLSQGFDPGTSLLDDLGNEDDDDHPYDQANDVCAQHLQEGGDAVSAHQRPRTDSYEQIHRSVVMAGSRLDAQEQQQEEKKREMGMNEDEEEEKKKKDEDEDEDTRRGEPADKNQNDGEVPQPKQRAPQAQQDASAVVDGPPFLMTSNPLFNSTA